MKDAAPASTASAAVDAPAGDAPAAPAIHSDPAPSAAEGFASMGLDARIQRAAAKMGFAGPTLVQATAIPLALQGKDILARARTGSGKTAAYCIPIVQKILAAKTSTAGQDAAQAAIRALVLVPTRELAEQVHRHIQQLAIYASKEVRSVNIAVSDVSIESQRAILAEMPDIVVATPARIVAHMDANTVNLRESLESLVIDEADLILSYGYSDDLKKLLGSLPRIYQSYLMSATLTADVSELKQLVLRNPAILKLEETQEEQVLLTQYYIRCTDEEKYLLMYFMLKLHVHPFGSGKSLIFVNSIDRCYRLKLFLEQFGIKSCTLNSELPLKSRYHIVQEFNKGVYDFIIATDESGDLKGMDIDSDDEADKVSAKKSKKAKKSSKAVDAGKEEAADDKESVDDVEDDVAEDAEDAEDKEEESGDKNEDAKGEAKGKKAAKGKKKPKRKTQDQEYGVARGIDFINVQAVINFDLPRTSRAYQHRVGRTARGVGNKGYALSFVTPDETAKSVQLADSSVKVTGKRKRGNRNLEDEEAEAVRNIKLATDEHMLRRIQKRQTAMGRDITEFTFDMKQVEGFRYRCTDAMRAVTVASVREARLKEIKSEILNSEKLKAHFEENPQDLHALRHDKPLHPARVLSHMRHVPDYLMPKGKVTVSAGSSKGNVPFRVDSRRHKKNKQYRAQPSKADKRKADPLKSFKYTPKE